MRTNTTKQLEVMTFEKLSTWSILAGVSHELYKRYDTEVWAFMTFSLFAYILWDKLA